MGVNVVNTSSSTCTSGLNTKMFRVTRVIVNAPIASDFQTAIEQIISCKLLRQDIVLNDVDNQHQGENSILNLIRKV